MNNWTNSARREIRSDIGPHEDNFRHYITGEREMRPNFSLATSIVSMANFGLPSSDSRLGFQFYPFAGSPTSLHTATTTRFPF
jgi:hypothetical protein